jgi:hypothetical protein
LPVKVKYAIAAYKITKNNFTQILSHIIFD